MTKMLRGAGLLSAVSLAALMSATAPQNAVAAGYALKEQSASGLGTSFAGATANGMNDASGMFFNPAALGVLEGNQVVQQFTGVMPYAKIENARGSYATALGGRSISGDANPGDAGQDAIVPSGYAMMSISPDLKVGIAITVPWGLATDYPSNWIGRYHAVESELRTINVQPTVSYRINPMITVGGGLQMQYAKATLSQMTDAATLIRRRTGLALTPGSLDAYARLNGDDIGWGAVAGVMIEPAKGTRIGLSYRSAVKHDIEGDIQFSGLPAAFRTALPSSNASAKVVTPEIASLGAYHEFNDRWAVMADVSWTNWSRFRELRVNFENPNLTPSVTEEKWRDAWFFAVGASYKPMDNLTLRVGAAYDQSPTPDADRTPRIPDEERYWLSAGASFKFNDLLTVDLSYAHLFVPDASLNQVDTLTGPNAARGNLSGTYKNHVDLVGVQAKLSF
ncbi:long-chain fatty acid transport protein [Azospirillum fermentarium]|uniref:OmpP1/FadL family transporter n=1 Tax=Azospirillum fermentarium TaxID=1233114 RepID=UPI002225E527|nr:outer membrane protein transport protein [Azospirillum fermentarium]MCW2247591.1 long-chain fatty acid transport protein [Azospirillum fermentarium]